MPVQRAIDRTLSGRFVLAYPIARSVARTILRTSPGCLWMRSSSAPNPAIGEGTTSPTNSRRGKPSCSSMILYGASISVASIAPDLSAARRLSPPPTARIFTSCMGVSLYLTSTARAMVSLLAPKEEMPRSFPLSSPTEPMPGLTISAKCGFSQMVSTTRSGSPLTAPRIVEPSAVV